MILQRYLQGRSQITKVAKNQYVRWPLDAAFIINPFVMFAPFLRWQNGKNALVDVSDNLVRQGMAFLFARVIRASL